MYAMTLWQPMAHAVIHFQKDTENRPRTTPWRGVIGSTIAIHAGLTWNDQHAAIVADLTGQRLTQRDVHFGALLGTVDVADVHWSEADGLFGPCCDPWGFEHGAHLTLQRPRALREPIPCRGALGVWTVPEHVALELEGARR